MASVNKSQGQNPRIMVGLPDIQNQIRLVKRASITASEPELGRWDELGNLLCELYTQLQHQKQVTIYRFAGKSATSSDNPPKAGSKNGRGRD
jgi:hypothetical protein